jgi:hypothetical protein
MPHQVALTSQVCYQAQGNAELQGLGFFCSDLKSHMPYWFSSHNRVHLLHDRYC